MSAKHTATPWVVATNAGGPETLIRAGNERTGRRIADTFASQPSAKTREGYIASRKENEANAEFIVRACNAHDDLLDALYRALPFVEEAETDPHYKTGAASKVVAQIREALAKAGAA